MIPHPFPLSPQGALESHDPSASTYTRQLKLQDAIVPHDPLPLICAQQLNPQGALVSHDPLTSGSELSKQSNLCYRRFLGLVQQSGHNELLCARFFHLV